MQNSKLEMSMELSASNAMRCVVGCFSFFSLAVATAWSCNIIIMTPHLKCGKTYYCYATHFTLCVGSLTVFMFMLIRIFVFVPVILLIRTNGFSSIVAACNWIGIVVCMSFAGFSTTMSSSVGIHNEHLSCFGSEQRWDKLKFPFADFGECVKCKCALKAYSNYLTWK